ncbi:MAG: hypothetical protein WCG85_09155 [Polyangia bacterium]
MPTDDGFGAYDGDCLDYFAEDASGQGEDDTIPRANSGLSHRTLQHDDLLAKDDIFREESGTRTEG